jgi:electron transport complex protein RnfC
MRSLRGKFHITDPPVFFEDIKADYSEIKKDFKRNYYTFDRVEFRERVTESGVYSLMELEKIEAEGCNKVVGSSLCMSPFSGFSYYLSLKFAESILKGLKILMESVAADSAEILVPSNYPGLAEVYKKGVERSPNIFLRMIKDYYPLGFTRILHRSIYGLSKIQEYFPGVGGVLITPVEKLLDIYIQVEEPENSGLKPVAVLSEKKNLVVWARPETKISEVLRLASIEEGTGFIVKEDPLYGKAVVETDKEILRETSRIFVFSDVNINPWKCVKCGRCIQVCPVYLRYPHSMAVLEEKKGIVPFREVKGCSGCGLCGFLCPGLRK